MIRKTWDFAFDMGLGPWIWDEILDTMAHQVQKIIIFIISPKLDFHGNL